MIMRRTRLAACAAALALAMGAPAMAQLPAMADRPLSAAERTRLASLEAQFVRISTQRNTSVAALRTIARSMGGRLTSQDPDQIIRAIEERADELSRSRERIGQLEQQLEALDSMKLAQAVGPLLTSARTAIDDGRLEDAERALEQAGDKFAQARGNLQGKVDQLAEREAETYGERASVRSAVFDDAGAAVLYARAAETVPASATVLRWRYRSSQAEQLVRQAGEHLDKAAAGEAVDVYRKEVLPLVSRAERPADWAASQSGLAKALLLEADQTADAAGQAEAIGLLRAAAEATPRAGGEDLWAERRVDLGNALAVVGQRHADPSMLKEAVALLQETVAAKPAKPAKAYAVLGNALDMLSRRDNSADLSAKSAAAYRAALDGLDRKSDERFWIRTKLNYASVLGANAFGQTDPAVWQAAATAFREVADSVDRQQSPFLWARAQRGFGGLLRDWSEVQAGAVAKATLTEALRRLRAAGEVITRESAAAEWAALEGEVALTLINLQNHEPGVALLEAAEKSARIVVDATSRNDEPAYWAPREAVLARVHYRMALRTRGKARAKVLASARRETEEALATAKAADQAALIEYVKADAADLEAQIKADGD
jgi:hypothetical protein